MKVVFILVVTAFTICLSRELSRHRHKKFPQRRETRQQDAYIGPKPGTHITDYSQSMGQTSDVLVKLNTNWIE